MFELVYFLIKKVDVSIVGGRDGSAGVNLRFHERAECRSLSKQAKETVRRWRSSEPDAFYESKCKVLGPSNQDTHPNERQKTGKDKRVSQFRNTQVAQI